MKEIKFRVWDGINMNFNPYIGGICSLDIINKNLGFIDLNKGLENIGLDNTNILMQYTGIKDKNRKEIYEGDILKDELGGWGCRYVYPHLYNNALEYLVSKDLKNPLRGVVYNIWRGEEVKIIGNIYQNPELLE